MQIARVLAGSAAAAVMVLVPQAAFAADGDYGTVGGGGGGVGAGGWLGRRSGSWRGSGSWAQGAADTASGLPSTGSSALDTAIAGAGLLLLVGGGAVVVASRRKELETA